MDLPPYLVRGMAPDLVAHIQGTDCAIFASQAPSLANPASPVDPATQPTLTPAAQGGRVFLTEENGPKWESATSARRSYKVVCFPWFQLLARTCFFESSDNLKSKLGLRCRGEPGHGCQGGLCKCFCMLLGIVYISRFLKIEFSPIVKLVAASS
jgi:hypothetical protein